MHRSIEDKGYIVYMKSNVAIEGRSEEEAVSTLERETGFMTEAFVIIIIIIIIIMFKKGWVYYLFPDPQDEVGPSISSSVVLCSFVLLVYIVVLVLVVCLCV